MVTILYSISFDSLIFCFSLIVRLPCICYTDNVHKKLKLGILIIYVHRIVYQGLCCIWSGEREGGGGGGGICHLL